MARLLDTLSEYACYHRDPRNILTHMIGIPIILLGTTALLSRPSLSFGDHWLSPATLVTIWSGLSYLRMDRRYGAAMSIVLLILFGFGHALAAASTSVWLSVSLGLFVFGWTLQLIGHHYEGRKPAFLDDMASLQTGPLFIAAEIGFALGLRRDLQYAIEHRAGRVRRRRTVAVQHH